jgi:hypothetical protein
MNLLTTPQAINRVVAWHNRHPMAQRITPGQVTGVGVVALPFVQAGSQVAAVQEPVLEAAAEPSAAGASLRERAQAAAQVTPAAPLNESAPTKLGRAAFSERFITSPSLRRLARFARQHGCHKAPSASLGPQRKVEADAALSGNAEVALLYLGTAAIEDGQRRVRVLWGQGSAPSMLGPRLWSRTRIAVLGAGCSACVLLAGVVPLWMQHKPAAEPGQMVAKAAAVVAAASATPTPTNAMPPPVLAMAPAPQPAASEPVAIVSMTPPPALAGDQAWPPSIRPRIDPGRRQHARQDSASLRTVAAAKAMAATPSAAKPGAAYAVVARSTKSRAASEMLLTFMQSAANTQGKSSQHTEVLPDAKGWRASWWPFASRQEAERARAALASSGMQLEIVEF